MESPRISTVLFDADGVVQFAGELYAHFDAEYGWSQTKVNEFFHHLFYERPEYDGGLTGGSDLLPVVTAALAEWGWTAPAEAFVRDWLTLGAVPDPEALELIATLRQAGVQCALGSNQELIRARFMDEELDYRSVFDECFYSARLGCAKPDAAFFQAVLAALGTEPERVLFIDDNQENVESARQCGLQAELHQRGDRLRDLLAGYRLPI